MIDAFSRIVELGGPVVVILIAFAIASWAVFFYKIWQFGAAGVGRHKPLERAIDAWQSGDRTEASRSLDGSSNYLAPILDMAMRHDDGANGRAVIEAEAEARFSRIERGFRFMDSVAQIAPLMGLFGTVLGMIQAFQSLQDAGSQVDPSVLAGGIWVALLTTAVGLAVAMPAALALSWLESRVDRERVFASRAISILRAPSTTRRRPEAETAPAYA